jgi:hypothetical protein
MHPKNKVKSLETFVKKTLLLKHGSRVMLAFNWLLLGADQLVILLLVIGVQYPTAKIPNNEPFFFLCIFVILSSFFLLFAEFVYFLVMVYLLENSKNILFHFSLLLLIAILLLRENIFWNYLDF